MAAAGALPAIAVGTRATAQTAIPTANAPTLPDKASFLVGDTTYLDSGSQHPTSVGAKAAAEAYLGHRTFAPNTAKHSPDEDVIRAYLGRSAALV